MKESYLENYREVKPHYLKRILWSVINKTIFRLLVGPWFKKARIMLLKMFGAQCGKDCDVYPSAVVFAPWNLRIGNACIGPRVNVYNKDIVTIGDRCVVSQDSTICTASHNIYDDSFALITSPIHIESYAWVASDAFVGMGVTIGEGAVVGARAAVFKDVEPWTVVGGNPAQFIKKRVLKK